ncbi:asparagine synthase-related protein [Aliifodinibius sp. S!AR15-10]|uniref:asparagine synthase-related protein n=1 Tax=Aliifodinibius sp. S!AR15-10 TaxID=2950437 RepID=UPI0028674F4C|nr:asparagine synthase-related protein [Aliifodinibius sp. S!AR15-10]MDR8391842.1 asparagine synthase-related protein [Aliifodinibius sp. S!AR15-10]
MANQTTYVSDFVNLISPELNQIFNMSEEEAEKAVASGNPEKVREIEGQFAIVQKEGNQVFLARSIGRPMRYFLAKQESGPLLIVAERIDEIHNYLEEQGMAGQFHPSYTRMVPAHYVVRLDVVGCPDPSPTYKRYFEPEQNRLNEDLDEIGRAYIGALADECQKWLKRIHSEEPIGVLFSGGIDSGSVFLVLHHLMLEMGLSPQRLKAFTLSVDGGPDVEQAHEFLDQLDMSLFLEVMETSKSKIDFREAIEVIEDYKPLDVQAAAMTLALCKQIRQKYPDWTYLADGDGGDENLKDYPIDANDELTIRSVLNNPLLYHEGWGVDKMKHSLTYSGGQSRGHVRTYAPARKYNFKGFSPYALPNVIEVSEGIPFIQLTDWSEEELYALKGEIVQRGVKQITGIDMPVFPKRRFQHGTVTSETFNELFPENETEYRSYFSSLYAR